MILALDSDDAGEKAKIRVIREALPLGINIKMVKNIPGSKDPADILSGDGGVDIWKNVLKESTPPIESLCLRIIEKKIPRDKQINEVKEIIFPIIKLQNNSVDRHESARIVEKYFSIPVEYIIKDIDALKNENPNSSNIQNILDTKESDNKIIDIKDKLYGLIYASELIDGPLKDYRDNLKKWLKEEVPEDIARDDLESTSLKKEELSLAAEISFMKSGGNASFVEDVKLQYEESVIRAIVAKVKSELLKNENDKDLITNYTNLQKKIELIKQKRRNI